MDDKMTDPADLVVVALECIKAALTGHVDDESRRDAAVDCLADRVGGFSAKRWLHEDWQRIRGNALWEGGLGDPDQALQRALVTSLSEWRERHGDTPYTPLDVDRILVDILAAAAGDEQRAEEIYGERLKDDPAFWKALGPTTPTQAEIESGFDEVIWLLSRRKSE
jgi:hypothetical protein